MPCSCPLVHRISENLPTGGHGTRKKDRYITPAACSTTCPLRYGPQARACLALTASAIIACVWPYEIPVIRPHRRASHPRTGPTGKSFWKGGVRGGRTFFQKGFPPRKLFFASFSLLQIFRRLPAVPKTKKSPAERGQKKTPSRCELQGGLEQSLAAAYFPT